MKPIRVVITRSFCFFNFLLLQFSTKIHLRCCLLDSIHLSEHEGVKLLAWMSNANQIILTFVDSFSGNLRTAWSEERNIRIQLLQLY